MQVGLGRLPLLQVLGDQATGTVDILQHHVQMDPHACVNAVRNAKNVNGRFSFETPFVPARSRGGDRDSCLRAADCCNPRTAMGAAPDLRLPGRLYDETFFGAFRTRNLLARFARVASGPSA